MTLINDEDFLYSREELKFREFAREFVEGEIQPIAKDVERTPFPEKDWRALMRKMGKEGYTGIMIPPEYGGMGKSLMYQLLAGEEISAESPALTMGFGASCTLSAIPILRFGSEEQKQKYLVPLAKGETIGALAITEPNVGSDTAGMETKAVWDEKEQVWILNGEKRFITNGSIADQIVTFAITDPSVDSKSGMSAFIIESNWEGFSVIKDYDLMGRRGVRNTHFKIVDMRVPPENMLGRQNQGFLILMDELDTERVGIAAESLGCMRKPFEVAVEHSMNRVQFGRPISRFEGISFKIADMATLMRAARLMTVTAARMIEQSKPATKEATMAKLFSTEAAVKVTDMAIQILGGEGYVKDYSGIEKFYRDSRLGTIGGGTSEIMRFLIQREVYIEQKRGKVPLGVPAIEIDFSTLMASIPKGFRPDRAEGVKAQIQFEFSDGDHWLLDIHDQQCHVEKGMSKEALMTVTTDSETWKSIMLGQMDAMQAMMAGKVNITTEDMELLMKFARMFKFTPETFIN
ncbi:MAG: acyl-CoA dehydrogenase family protein [Candidatus Heimdallarchaeota archaeon]|nr:MAG: acyl-CoA dehydrogenase family protein [Candidatus Heimdallarchaeota archaeon]